MIAHIKRTSDDNKSWCNKELGTDFHFKDAELAAIAGINPTETKACSKCIDTIIICFIKIKESNIYA